MTIGIYNDEVTVDGDLFEVYDNTYDNLILIIEWLIGRDNFKRVFGVVMWEIIKNILAKKACFHDGNLLKKLKLV